ncbi:replication/maintenance protein RepL [Saccharospirillum salsuginis]|uniref:Plasmid replication protein RepL domain-containing protein n=1 Tax=Saccharospirillum salsuginis TaxID=418750 RepID=A0A918N7P2_9GAMM|nr:replication/maintenance protein RepL [Saccharospirillum salsuginis]GGX51462.1 hypothetical protein GCM10007392_18440 [Saccharospirillum salsuginis]
MERKKKVVRSIEKQTINEETGEVKQSSRENIVHFPSEPPYVKLYLEDIEYLYQLSKNSHRVLFELIKRMDYEGLVVLNSSIKKVISSRVGYRTVASLDNYISKELIKKGIFKRVDTGVYQPNPNLFGRGEWKDIKKKRDGWIKIDYKDGERVIKSSLSS